MFISTEINAQASTEDTLSCESAECGSRDVLLDEFSFHQLRFTSPVSLQLVKKNIKRVESLHKGWK